MTDHVERLMRDIGEAEMTCSLSIATWGQGRDVQVQFIADVWAPIPDGKQESPYHATSRGDTAIAALRQAYDQVWAWAADVQP